MEQDRHQEELARRQQEQARRQKEGLVRRLEEQSRRQEKQARLQEERKWKSSWTVIIKKVELKLQNEVYQHSIIVVDIVDNCILDLDFMKTQEEGRQCALLYGLSSIKRHRVEGQLSTT